MSEWKDNAIASWERHSEGCAAQEAEHKANRIECAKEQLNAALEKLNIPLPANAEIRVIDDPDFGALPFVTIDDVEFTYGPGQSRQSGHGGGLGIITSCPRCQVRLRGPYIYDEKILGRELLEPQRIEHECVTEEDSQLAETDKPQTTNERFLESLRNIIDDRIQERNWRVKRAPKQRTPLDGARAQVAEQRTIQCQLKLKVTPRQERQLNRWLWRLTGVYNWAIKKIGNDAEGNLYYTSITLRSLLNGYGAKINVPQDAISGTLLTAHAAWQKCFRKQAKRPHLKGRRNRLNAIAFAHGTKLHGYKVLVPGLGRVSLSQTDRS